MKTNITLFAQIVKSLDRKSFNSQVVEHQSDKHSKGIDSWMHLITMLFSHFSKLGSLRDVTNGLRSASGNLNHLGLLKSPSKSSLSYQNEHRDWKLFKDYYFELLPKLSASAGFKQTRFKIKSKIYLLDSTTISLCLSLFDWAKFRRKKGAVKLHTLLDYDSCLPTYLSMTDGKVHDAKAAREITLPSDSVVVADRAYVDFVNLCRWDKEDSYYVVRLKNSIKFNKLSEIELPENRHEHILVDEFIELSEEKTRNKYPKKLRRVVVWDEKNKQVIELITNQFTWTANTIGELYKARWEIELFFKEIKQHLRIKTFLGTSANAVLIQIWTAMITILLLKYFKAMAKHGWCLSNLISFIRINLLVKMELKSLLDDPFQSDIGPPEDASAQFNLF